MSGTASELEQIVRSSSSLMRVLESARELDLPDWLIVSGAVYQRVWNHITGRDPDYGVKDHDLVYFDASDLSYEAEDRVIRHAVAVCQELPGPPVEVRNQARVHFTRRRNALAVWLEACPRHHLSAADDYRLAHEADECAGPTDTLATDPVCQRRSVHLKRDPRSCISEVFTSGHPPKKFLMLTVAFTSLMRILRAPLVDVDRRGRARRHDGTQGEHGVRRL